MTLTQPLVAAADKTEEPGRHRRTAFACAACAILVLLVASAYRVATFLAARRPYPPAHTPSSELIRGVSLGGWLVLEAFITPSLFARANDMSRALGGGRPSCPGLIVDQWSLHACLGANRSLELLAPHWRGWVSRDDLHRLRASGINTVRVPLPYWLVDIQDGEPWVGQAQMADALRRALVWCVELGLKVFVDLHAAPGSQNGFDNSGRMGATEWQAADASGQLRNLGRTLEVWRRLIALLAHAAAEAGVATESMLSGVEVVNEAPWFDPNIDRDVLRAFIVDAYFELRAKLGDTVAIYFHDGFSPHAWSDFLQGARFVNVRLDRHEYQTFDAGEVRWPSSKHLRLACEQAFSIEQNIRTHRTVVGEFSLATNDCDPWLNGYGKGSRYEGTPPFDDHPAVGSCEPLRRADKFAPAYHAFLRRYAEAQMRSWDVGDGWIFWNFKTEGGCAPHFDYLLGVSEGYLPPLAGIYMEPAGGCPAHLRRTMVR
ncbi:hypothetical protein KFE25_006507 [Diacronema lutheri]|uniref:glucan 1,3-beta-glucosidase n=1 Tax=Diacronema lutheri TaxID=2081491 RepID=A0A8J5XWP4_DIALT|nr:hypothetical protein KFE25_006507 [Diacronema lutheri]